MLLTSAGHVGQLVPAEETDGCRMQKVKGAESRVLHQREPLMDTGECRQQG